MTGQGWRGYPAESAYDIASQLTDMNPSDLFACSSYDRPAQADRADEGRAHPRASLPRVVS